MTQHFAERVRERLPGVDPDALAVSLWWAIDTGRTDLVEYVGRQNKYGGRLFRFRVGERSFTVAANTTKRILLTVFEGDAGQGPQAKCRQ